MWIELVSSLRASIIMVNSHVELRFIICLFWSTRSCSAKRSIIKIGLTTYIHALMWPYWITFADVLHGIPWSERIILSLPSVPWWSIVSLFQTMLSLFMMYFKLQGYRSLLQLSPILILVLISILSAFLQPDATYNLRRTKWVARDMLVIRIIGGSWCC